MNRFATGYVVILCLVFCGHLVAQQAAPVLAQADSMIPQSLAAQTGAMQISDVTLTGTVTVTHGTLKDSGTIVLTAVGNTQSQVTITTSSGTRTEIRAVTPDGVQSEKWIGPDGTVERHPVQSLATPNPAWFLPAFVMAAESSSGYANSYVGRETKNAVAVEHLRIWQLPQGKNAAAPADFLRTQTQHDVYLDPATFLPGAMVFYMVPELADKSVKPFRPITSRLPVEVRFSNYKQVDGRPIAFHIQLYFDGQAVMDIQLASAVFNTGVVVASTN